VSGNSVVLDTSAAIALLAGQAGALLSDSPKEFVLPAPVIGELRYGALNSRRSAENLAEVERLVSRCRALDITATTAAVYARLRLSLRSKGKPIPENDLWIAAGATAGSIAGARPVVAIPQLGGLHHRYERGPPEHEGRYFEQALEVKCVSSQHERARRPSKSARDRSLTAGRLPHGA
jgi:tRNA(fMet)-specific endonuclease VapC